jgi:hypothetical protein
VEEERLEPEIQQRDSVWHMEFALTCGHGDEGMTHQVLIFGLYGFVPGRSPFGRILKPIRVP